jgi:hypothetical protein
MAQDSTYKQFWCWVQTNIFTALSGQSASRKYLYQEMKFIWVWQNLFSSLVKGAVLIEISRTPLNTQMSQIQKRICKVKE